MTIKEIQTQIENIKKTIYGNSKKGILDRLTRVEVKLYGIYIMNVIIIGMLVKLLYK